MEVFLCLRQCFRLENNLRESKTFGNRSKTRTSDEVNRKCYFFCEGQETEPIYFAKLKETVESECDYRKFSCEQRLVLENTVLLVGFLYEMCKVQLVEKADTKKSLNKINEDEIFAQIEKSKQALQEIQRI